MSGESRTERDPYQDRGRAEGFIFISESSSASPVVTSELDVDGGTEIHQR